jgi:NAD+ synthase
MRLGVRLDNLPISQVFDLVKSGLSFLFKGKEEDITEENMQSRIRALLLMAISNKFNEMLLSTTNKSEAATGYGTIYGDIAGGFAPIKDVYKTQVYRLCNWRNKNIPKGSKLNKIDVIPQNIIYKAPSAELKPNQLDSDSLPDYDILDKILYELIENDISPEQLNFDINLSKRVYKMLLRSEHKRRQAPPGIKINRVTLSRDRRYPITNYFYRDL